MKIKPIRLKNKQSAGHAPPSCFNYHSCRHISHQPQSSTTHLYIIKTWVSSLALTVCVPILDGRHVLSMVDRGQSSDKSSAQWIRITCHVLCFVWIFNETENVHFSQSRTDEVIRVFPDDRCGQFERRPLKPSHRAELIDYKLLVQKTVS